MCGIIILSAYNNCTGQSKPVGEYSIAWFEDTMVVDTIAADSAAMDEDYELTPTKMNQPNTMVDAQVNPQKGNTKKRP